MYPENVDRKVTAALLGSRSGRRQLIHWGWSSLAVPTIAIIALAALAHLTTADPIVWDGSTSEFWHVADNWDSNTIPTGSDDVTVGAPAPTVVESSANTNELDVLSTGQLDIEGGSFFSVTGGRLTNDGLITVNSDDSASIATLFFVGNSILDGSGDVVLAAPGSLAQLSASGANTVTQGADHTIRGEGDVRASLINNGTITAEDANGDSMGTLLLSTNAKTNNGIIQSSPTGDITFSASVNQGAGGRMIADTGTMFVSNITITGGTLESTGGGVFETTGNALTFNSLHLTGELDMVSTVGHVPTLVIDGTGVVNDGTIVVSSNDTGGAISFATPTTISGSGEVILNYELGGARITGFTQGTNGADHTIRGVGSIESPLINDGTIIAEPRNGTVLQITGNTKTNNNLIRADAGATLRILSTTITQDDTNGRIVANEGVVELGNSGKVVGGRVETVGAGVVNVTGNASVEDLTNQGPINILGGKRLDVLGSTLTNNGTITVHSDAVSAFTGMHLASDITIDGTGQIVLPYSGASAQLIVDSGFTATQAAGHTVHGLGQINGPGVFINNGTVEGNSAAEPLEVNGTIGGSGLLKDVRIDGTHAPGNSGGTASMSLEGAYTINNFAHLDMDLGGTTAGSEYDQLTSTDTGNVVTIMPAGSQLNVSLIDDFVPSIGDTFALVSTAGSITGDFGIENLPTIANGTPFIWALHYNPQDITLELVSLGIPGDYNADGTVNAADYTVWRDTLGSTTDLRANGDDTGASADRIDEADYAVWKSNFGMTAPGAGVGAISSTPAAAVPEPTTAVLLCLGAIGAFAECRRTGPVATSR